MRLVIDGEVVTTEAAGIAQALDLARERAAEAGRTIIEVHADGRPAGTLLDAPSEGTEGVAELGVTTADTGLFLAETLREAGDALNRVRTDQKQAADQLDQGEVAGALGSLRPVIEGWQMVRTVVDQSAALLGVDLQELPVGGGSASDLIQSLASDLVALRDAVSHEDWSALGDVLGFDLEERAAAWLGLIDALVRRAEGSPAKDPA